MALTIHLHIRFMRKEHECVVKNNGITSRAILISGAIELRNTSRGPICSFLIYGLSGNSRNQHSKEANVRFSGLESAS